MIDISIKIRSHDDTFLLEKTSKKALDSYLEELWNRLNDTSDFVLIGHTIVNKSTIQSIEAYETPV